jgi:hypothetical protein
VSYSVFQPVSCAMAIFVAATAPPELRPENVTVNHHYKRPIEPECPLLCRDWCNEGCSRSPPGPLQADRLHYHRYGLAKLAYTFAHVMCTCMRRYSLARSPVWCAHRFEQRRFSHRQGRSRAVAFSPVRSECYLDVYICLCATVRQLAWPFQSTLSSQRAAEARRA